MLSPANENDAKPPPNIKIPITYSNFILTLGLEYSFPINGEHTADTTVPMVNISSNRFCYNICYRCSYTYKWMVHRKQRFSYGSCICWWWIR